MIDNQKNTSIDPIELEKFQQLADLWWDPKGVFKPLHLFNPPRVEFIKNNIELSGSDLLDVGCGGGLLSEAMCNLGAKVTGIDIVDKNIKVAKLHAEKSKLNIDYLVASPEELIKQNNNKKFDIILAMEVIEHVANVKVFVDALAKLLKPGGTLFIATINRTIKSYIFAIVGAEYIMRWLPKGTHSWNKFLTPEEIEILLNNNNLNIINKVGMQYRPWPWNKYVWQTNKNNLAVNYILVAK